jgi:hypothetical protein
MSETKYSGPAVRCIDCMKRKQCKRVRINKYAKKPCEDFDEDLAREAKANAAAARRKIG